MERRIPITDKRSLHDPPQGVEPDATPDEVVSEQDVSEQGQGEAMGPSSAASEENDLHDRHLRLQAEFDNYRKRMTKQLSDASDRGVGALLRLLLPVLDDFERAIEHGEGGEGVALVHKGLKEVLESEGLEEIPALDVPFDPHVHEAVQSVDDAEVAEPMCKQVWRRGYAHRERVLRPAMVVVSRPPEQLPEDAGDTVPAGE